MLGFQGPAQPSPAPGDALNAGYGYLEVRCLGCNTHQTVALDIVRRPKFQRRSMNLSGTCAAASAPKFVAIPTSAAIWWHCARQKAMVALDGKNRPRVVLKTIELTQRQFDQVDEAFAYDEGEGDRSLAYWREAHNRYFTRLGLFETQMMLWCERFRVEHVIERY
jgi:ASCH domain